MAGAPEEVPPSTRRKIQEVDCGVSHGWVAVYQAVAKRMLSYLEHREVLKLKTRQLEFHRVGTKRAECRH